MIRVKLIKEFLQIKETLERIGVPSTRHDVPRLYPSCVIYYVDGDYYISHFKEMIEKDGREVEYKEEDLSRRDNIINMLTNWGMIVPLDEISPFKPGVKVKILKHQDKSEWKIVPKYTVK
jgi:hypothetical protein